MNTGTYYASASLNAQKFCDWRYCFVVCIYYVGPVCESRVCSASNACRAWSEWCFCFVWSLTQDAADAGCVARSHRHDDIPCQCLGGCQRCWHLPAHHTAHGGTICCRFAVYCFCYSCVLGILSLGRAMNTESGYFCISVTLPAGSRAVWSDTSWSSY